MITQPPTTRRFLAGTLGVLAMSLSWLQPRHALAATGQLSVLPDSAAAMAMAGGRFSTVADPTALRHSPAMILEIEQPETQINFGAWKPDIDYRSPNAGSTYLVDDWLRLASVYHVRPLDDGDTAFGIGLSTPFGLSYEYPRNFPFRYVLPYKGSITTLDITPVYAFRLGDRVTAAAGLDLVHSELELEQDFPWSALSRAPTPDGVLSFAGDGWGFGGFFGIAIELPRGQRLAMSARLPIEISYEGDFTAAGLPPALESAGYTPRSRFESQIEFPPKLSLGYSRRINERLTLGADFEWAGNSVHEELPLHIGVNQSLLGTEALALEWQDSRSLGLGAQWRLGDDMALRASYLYTETAMPDYTFTPAVASNDRHALSVGAAHELGAHVIDFTYSFVRMEDRNVDRNQTPQFVGTYTFDWHIFTLSYRFKH